MTLVALTGYTVLIFCFGFLRGWQVCSEKRTGYQPKGNGRPRNPPQGGTGLR